MEKTEKCTETKVLILGAGVAGIAAAKYLHNAGIKDFIILEGNDCIGGRIKDTKFAGMTVELGANWIQGLGNNPVWELAKTCKLNGEIDYRDFIVRDTTGRDVTARAGQQELLAAQQEIYETVIPFARKNGLRDRSIREGLQQAGWFPDSAEKSAMEYWIYDWEFAVTPEVVPMKTERDFKVPSTIQSISDEQYFVNDQRGFKFILESLSTEFLNKNCNCLKLGVKVSTVEWGKEGVRVTTRHGETFKADYALMSFSLGVLQSGTVKFQPELPRWKKEIIKAHKMVLYNKIFLKFPYRFWDNVEYILFASGQRGHLQVWESLDAYKSFPRTTNVLLVTAIDEEAKRMEKMSKEEIQSEVMESLKKMYGKALPDPEDILIANWGQDEMFCGCWTQAPIGVTQEHYSKLQRPLDRLFFAGEGTHEHYNGYVHGGYLSGIERAADIVQHIKTKNTIETEHGILDKTKSEMTSNIQNPRE